MFKIPSMHSWDERQFQGINRLQEPQWQTFVRAAQTGLQASAIYYPLQQALNKNYMYSEYSASLRTELVNPSTYFKDCVPKTARNMMFTGILFATWNARCRNWTCNNDSVDQRPQRKVLASLWTCFFPPFFWNVLDAGITRQNLLMKQTGKQVNFTQGFGSVWTQHGLAYVLPWKVNWNSCSQAGATGAIMCYSQDNIRDLLRLTQGFTWTNYVISAVSSVGIGLSLGQAGIMGQSLWERQVLDSKFRMLDGSKVFKSEVDAQRTVTDDILFSSSLRFNGWRTTLMHHGPYYVLALLMAENFGLFDRNQVNNGINHKSNQKQRPAPYIRSEPWKFQ